MKLPAPLAIWLAIGGLRRVTLACLGLTVALLAVTAVLVLPGVVGGVLSPPPGTSIPGALMPLLPMLAAILGLITAALCLGVGSEISPLQPAAAGRANTADTNKLVFELRSLLMSEREELNAMRAACETATHDASAAGARLTRFVSDAETQISQALNPVGQSAEGARAAEMVGRLERMVPMISRVVEPDASAAVITGAAEAMERAISAAVSGAAGQIAALGDAAGILRRDAATLDKAAREIAMAGANVANRVGEAAAHVDAAVANLPAASATLTAAAERAVQVVEQASAAMSAETATASGILRDAGQSAETLRSNAAVLQQTGESFTQRLAGLGKEIEARLASFPALSQVVGSHAGQLLRNSESLLETARGAAQSSQSAAAAAARADTVVAGLAGLATQITDAAGVLKDSADGLRTASHSIVTDGGEAASRVEAATRDVLEALPGAREIVGVSCAALRESADVLAREVAGITEAGRAVAQSLAAENAQTLSLAHALHDVSAELRLQVDSVATNAAQMVGTGREAVAALRDETIQVAATLRNEAAYTATALRDEAAHATTALRDEVTHAATALRDEAAHATTALRDEVTHAATALRDDVAHAATALRDEVAHAATAIVDAAGNVERTVGGATSDMLTSVTQAVALIDTSRDDAAQAAAHLAEQAGFLTDAGRGLEHGTEAAIEQICAAMQTVIDEVAASGSQAASSLAQTSEMLEALDGAATATARAGDAAAAQLQQLAVVCTQAEAQAAALPAVAAQIEATLDLLVRSGTAMPHPEVLTRLSRAANELPPVADTLQRIVDDLPGVLDSRTAAHDEVLSSLKQTLSVLSGDVGETIRRLQDACAAADSAGAVMETSVARVQSAAELVSQAAAVPVDELKGASPAPLRHLDSLEREAAALMREGEVLAEAAATGRTEDVPVWLAGRSTEILSAVDTTIHRLRSVATAVAFASDAVEQRARVA